MLDDKLQRAIAQMQFYVINKFYLNGKELTDQFVDKVITEISHRQRNYEIAKGIS